MAKQKLEFHPRFCELWKNQGQENHYEGLREHILTTPGKVVLDPVIVWKGTKFIIDGHTRYTIADELGIAIKIEELEFATEDEVELWMRKHQDTARQLRPDQRQYNAGKCHELYCKIEAEKNAASGKGDKNPAMTGKITKKVADEFKVSTSTIENAVKHVANVDALAPDVKEEYIGGNLKASIKEIEKLAKLPKQQQKKVAKLVKDGDAKNIGQAVGKVATPTKPKQEKDSETQQSFDHFKRFIKHMPTAMRKTVRPNTQAILAEFKERGFC